jgi:cytochrome P450
MAEASSPQTAPAISRLLDPGLLSDPYPFYRMLRTTSPVFPIPIPGHTGPGAWVLTRHEDVHAVLRDSSFSVDRSRAAVVQENLDRVPQALLAEGGGLRSMLLLDPPDHTRLRGLVNKAFTPKRVAALRPRIEAIVAELLDAVEGEGGMDLIGAFAAPLPAIVIAELLGVPSEDHERFKTWSSDLVNAAGLSLAGPGEGFEAALERILAYLREIIAQRRRDPGDDLLSAMIEAQEDRDALTDEELLANSNLLLVAGHETTTNLIGNGLLALLRHRDQLDRLRAEPALLEPAVEELLRFDSPVQATVRVATADVELGGQRIEAGAIVACGIGAANRDPDAFPEPDRLDVARADNHHLSFGFGAHFCLGAPLARLEAKVAFEALLERFPELSLGEEEPRWRPNLFLRGLQELPLHLSGA